MFRLVPLLLLADVAFPPPPAYGDGEGEGRVLLFPELPLRCLADPLLLHAGFSGSRCGFPRAPRPPLLVDLATGGKDIKELTNLFFGGEEIYKPYAVDLLLPGTVDSVNAAAGGQPFCFGKGN